jgi:hypothetical protein
MSEQSHSMREDLAFMRGLAEDRDPLPWVFGAHLLAPGLLFAPCAFLAWAGLSGFVTVSGFWMQWAWVPAMAVYVPTWFWLSRAGPVIHRGPRKLAFGAAWAAMGLMTVSALICLPIASGRLNMPLMLFWPSIALTLYGGAWTVLAVAHQRAFYWLIALGAYASAIACAFLINGPGQWLMLGLGILACIAAPGLAIIVRARTARD